MMVEISGIMADTALANKELSLRDNQALNHFLASVEKRALRMAEIAVGNREDALDILQDSMLRLARHYGDKPAEQWPPLFFRTLNNRIIDHHRRRGVLRRFQNWIMPSHQDAAPENTTADHDFTIDGIPTPSKLPCGESALASEQRLQRLEESLKALPTRQQQAFMLRCWEGLSTRDTALAMKCSEGSVKTHYSRAIHQLRSQLGDTWP